MFQVLSYPNTSARSVSVSSHVYIPNTRHSLSLTLRRTSAPSWRRWTLTSSSPACTTGPPWRRTADTTWVKSRRTSSPSLTSATARCGRGCRASVSWSGGRSCPCVSLNQTLKPQWGIFPTFADLTVTDWQHTLLVRGYMEPLIDPFE